MINNSYLKRLICVLPILLLVSCGAKDNMVEGITPATGIGTSTALGAGGPVIANAKGSTLVLSYSTLFLQKLVETAKLFNFIEQADQGALVDQCAHISKEELSNKKDLLVINYYSDAGTGECSDLQRMGRVKFVTSLDSASEESWVVSKNASGIIKKMVTRANEQQLNFTLGIDHAPKRYVDGSIELGRSFSAKLMEQSLCSGYDRCYKVSSRLLLNVDHLIFSPSKNSAIKFKERDTRYDFRFSFILKIGTDKKVISLVEGKNNLFVKGERMKFNKENGFTYNGKLSLKTSSQELVLNNSVTKNCGYFSQGETLFSFKWGRRASLLRSMDTYLDASVIFNSDTISSTILRNRGSEISLEEVVDKNSCDNISQSEVGPFFNLYLLFAY